MFFSFIDANKTQLSERVDANSRGLSTYLLFERIMILLSGQVTETDVGVLEASGNVQNITH